MSQTGPGDRAGGPRVTTPRPQAWIRHHPRAHRIQDHVATEFEEMRLLLDENRREAALKKMPDSSMSAIEGLGIAPIELAHAQRESRLWGFEQEMIVVVHQTVGMAAPAVPIDDVGQEREKVRNDLAAFPTMSCRALPRL